MPYMVTFTINIPPMLAYIPYMDPMGYESSNYWGCPMLTHTQIIAPARQSRPLRLKHWHFKAMNTIG